MESHGKYRLMVRQVYIEKWTEPGPELWELRTEEEKTAKKTDKEVEGTLGEFSAVEAKKIVASSTRVELKGPALQNATQTPRKTAAPFGFSDKDEI